MDRELLAGMLAKDGQGKQINSDLLYEYAKYCLDSTKTSVEVLGTKLATVMEIGALLLLGLRITSSFQNFVAPKPAYLYFSYLGLKLSACIAIASAIAIAMFGIYPRNSKHVMPSDPFLQISFQTSESDSKLAIAKHWIEVTDELQTYKNARIELLRKSLIALGIGIFFAALTTTEAFVLAMAGHYS
jgi:dolichyl-phosphate-mannose--protein O-mannosyl transferase